MKHNAMTLQAQNNTNNNKINRRLCRNISGSREVYQHTHMLRLNFVAQWINNNKCTQVSENIQNICKKRLSWQSLVAGTQINKHGKHLPRETTITKTMMQLPLLMRLGTWAQLCLHLPTAVPPIVAPRRLVASQASMWVASTQATKAQVWEHFRGSRHNDSVSQRPSRFALALAAVDLARLDTRGFVVAWSYRHYCCFITIIISVVVVWCFCHCLLEIIIKVQ